MKVWWEVTCTTIKNKMVVSLLVQYIHVEYNFNSREGYRTKRLQDGKNPNIMDDLFHETITMLCGAKIDCWYKLMFDVDLVE